MGTCNSKNTLNSVVYGKEQDIVSSTITRYYIAYNAESSINPTKYTNLCQLGIHVYPQNIYNSCFMLINYGNHCDHVKFEINTIIHNQNYMYII